jgi:hypothetical protein
LEKLAGIDLVMARLQISDVVTKYARAGDRLDVDLFKSAFWEEGGYRDHVAPEPMHQMADWLIDGMMRNTFIISQHYVSNTLVLNINSEKAEVETYFCGLHVTQPSLGRNDLLGIIGERRLDELGWSEGKQYEVIVGGRYLDNFECRQGVWRIKWRRVPYDWTSMRDYSGLRRDEGLFVTAKANAVPARDRSDPSYQFDI